MTDLEALPPSARLMTLMAGSWISQAVYVAAKLGIADLLADGPRSSADLACATKAHADALHRILRALASVGIFAEAEDGRFALTPMAESLRSRAPGSLRALAVIRCEEWSWRAWGQLLHSARTGECAFEHVHGMQLFEYLARYPDAGRAFDAAMSSYSAMDDRAIAGAYDFRRGTIVDVGGGQGSLLAAILRQNSEAHGVLFDLPHVVERAAALIGEAGLSDRCRGVAGDFFDHVPAGGDLYLMKMVIHDWDDERALAILTNCRRAMTANSRRLLLENIVLPGNGPAFSKLLDLQMMVLTPGGKERTAAEYQTLLARASFKVSGIRPTECLLSIIEAMPT